MSVTAPLLGFARCTTAACSFYGRWGLPMAALLPLPLSLSGSLAAWKRLQRSEGASQTTQNLDAQFLAVLGFGRLLIGRGKWWKPFIPAAPLVFPMWALFHSVKWVQRRGGQVSSSEPVSRLMQLLEQYELYLRRPGLVYLAEHHDWYYRKRLYESANREQSGLSFPNLGALLALVNAAWLGKRPQRAELESKEAMRVRLQHANVPAIATIGRFGEGTAAFEPPYERNVAPQHDLFAKPIHGSQGIGARGWTLSGGDRYVDHDRKSEIRWQQLIEELTKSPTPYLLQPRLKNDPELTDLTGETLASVRIVTYTHPSTRVTTVLPTAFMKIPREGALVDNIHAPGGAPNFAAPVDTETGVLGPAFRQDDYSWHAVHPERQSRIAGRRVPGWHRLREVAVAAHEAFLPDFLVVGWDIAPTAEGPVVIEGNRGPFMPEEIFPDTWFSNVEDFGDLLELCFMAESKTISVDPRGNSATARARDGA